MSDHMSHSPLPNGCHQGISPCSSPGGLSSPNMMGQHHHQHQHHPHNINSNNSNGSILSGHQPKTSPTVTPSHTPTPIPPNQQLRPGPHSNSNNNNNNANNINNSMRMAAPSRPDHLGVTDLQNQSPNSMGPGMGPSNMSSVPYPQNINSPSYPNNDFINAPDMNGGGGGMGFNQWNQGSMHSLSPHNPNMVSHHSPVPMGSMPGQVSPLPITTLSGMHIKSEPITPPRDTTTPSSHLRPHSITTGHLSPSAANMAGGHISPMATGHLSPTPSMPNQGHISPGGSAVSGTGQGHLSPSGMPGVGPQLSSMSGHLSPGQPMVHSNNGSPVDTQQLDYDSPGMVKRSRMEGWTT
ncbi:hypothetical protein PoB_004785200 [Plakobranchus ocellatus]|uniref:Uncharacterized protein n=1 Tax=Plakobranchus ocellatus TaxID=259542 RepID=A0AAV4BQU8_9GAST|nr:hypothetical protein PoB_004785200 [Plakobranchus ocellatus]